MADDDTYEAGASKQLEQGTLVGEAVYARVQAEAASRVADAAEQAAAAADGPLDADAVYVALGELSDSLGERRSAFDVDEDLAEFDVDEDLAELDVDENLAKAMAPDMRAQPWRRAASGAEGVMIRIGDPMLRPGMELEIGPVDGEQAVSAMQRAVDIVEAFNRG